MTSYDCSSIQNKTTNWYKKLKITHSYIFECPLWKSLGLDHMLVWLFGFLPQIDRNCMANPSMSSHCFFLFLYEYVCCIDLRKFGLHFSIEMTFGYQKLDFSKKTKKNFFFLMIIFHFLIYTYILYLFKILSKVKSLASHCFPNFCLHCIYIFFLKTQIKYIKHFII